ncbi:hypothetical protein DESC_770071 [Desulfosarcina cetonica]|nr:hypothetical protein DESC_770071 [Desulfosarcina cetonica]
MGTFMETTVDDGDTGVERPERYAMTATAATTTTPSAIKYHHPEGPFSPFAEPLRFNAATSLPNANRNTPKPPKTRLCVPSHGTKRPSRVTSVLSTIANKRWSVR